MLLDYLDDPIMIGFFIKKIRVRLIFGTENQTSLYFSFQLVLKKKTESLPTKKTARKNKGEHKWNGKERYKKNNDIFKGSFFFLYVTNLKNYETQKWEYKILK